MSQSISARFTAFSPARVVAGLLLLLLCALALAIPARAQNAARDWSQTVTAAPNGAFIVGNPKAPHKLIEYLSYTCPHCGEFHTTGITPLKNQWIKRGLVSLEYRNFVRDPFDLTASLLARCGGAPRFLAGHEAVFSNQDNWMRRAQAYSQSQEGKPPAADRAAQLRAIADETGLTGILIARGLSSAAQRQCLADEAMLKTVLDLTTSARQMKEFTGTPFFILNGKPLSGVHTWDALRPLLPALPPSGK
jgi:protein-disulfide isomerase